MHPNFTGIWKADFGRSKLSIAAPDSTIFDVSHREPRFRLKRTHVFQGKSDVFEIELEIDGREVVIEAGRRSIRCRMQWEGQELVLHAVVETTTETVTDEVRYRLSEDGASFTALERLRSPSLRADNLWVLERISLP